MDEVALQPFEELLVARTGLRLRERDHEAFHHFLQSRVRALRLPSPVIYHQLLTSHLDSHSGEWEKLVSLLANNESYFFRDSGQFSLLKYRLIPELIKRNSAKRSLRVWSAGCSTGEEPYSLAILIDQLLFGTEQWKVTIIGTDLDGEALEHARRGVYEKWSFRSMPPDLQKHYFQQRKDSWELDPRVQRTVTFRSGNLLRDTFPCSILGISDMDLILCRNVFIYFDRDAITEVLHKMSNTLSEGGYLVTGHAELHDQKLHGLQARSYPESVVYQRGRPGSASSYFVPAETASAFPVSDRDNTVPVEKRPRLVPPPPRERELLPQQTGNSSASFDSHLPPAMASSEILPTASVRPTRESSDQPGTEPASAGSQALLREAELLVAEGHYLMALDKLSPLLDLEPRNHAALVVSARAYANLGEHDKSSSLCQQAIEADALGVLPYYLLAHITEEQGDFSQAKELLKKVIYLSPGMAAVYLELAAVYDRERDSARAATMRDSAMELVGLLPGDSLVDPFGHLTARELAQQIQEVTP